MYFECGILKSENGTLAMPLTKMEDHFTCECNVKNGCDGIGGTVGEASRASIKAVSFGQIIITKQLFECCHSDIT